MVSEDLVYVVFQTKLWVYATEEIIMEIYLNQKSREIEVYLFGKIMFSEDGCLLWLMYVVSYVLFQKLLDISVVSNKHTHQTFW